MTEAILIVLAIMIIGASLLYIIKQVSDFYSFKYSFSLWAGVLLMSVAFFFLALIAGATESATIYVLQAVAIGLFLFTLIQDIRLSNIGMGLIAFVLQFLLTISAVAIVLVFFARWVINKILGKRSAFSINPGIAIGLNTGKPFRQFFTLFLGRRM